MKELSIEEKAKAYDRVSKEVKDFFEGRQKMYSDVNQTLEFLFPELKKSKDERIRKAIIALVRQSSEILAEQNQNNMIAWLNKQGEYKSPEEVLKIRQELYQSGYNDGYKHGCEVSKKGEKKHKFIIGDTIISDNNTIYRVDDIIKNCIGQDCYFLVDIEREKKGMRYFEMTDPQGKKYNFGEITWLCEQVDAKFEKQSVHHIACSEEQMKVLDEVLNFAANHESPYWNYYIFEILNNLIRQLKTENIKL